MNLSPELFSDIFARRDNAVTRIDPRPKLILALAIIVCVICSQNGAFPLVVFLACLVSSLALAIPVTTTALHLASPLAIVCTLVIIQSVMSGKTPLFTVDVAAWEIVFTKEGLESGLLTGSRVFGATSVLFILSVVTPAHKIFHALRWLRVPHSWIEIAVLMYRYLFALLDLITETVAAQRVRLGYSGFRRSLRSIGIAAGTVLVRSMDQAVRTHEAMELRGYRGRLPFGTPAPLSRSDLLILGIGGPFIIGMFVLCQGGVIR